MSKLGGDIGRQRGTMGTGWKKDPWDKMSLQPASTSAAANQGPLQQSSVPYAPGLQAQRQTETTGQSQKSDVGAAAHGGPSLPSFSPYSLLPTPKGQSETEELRAETRQRTQLAKGVSPGELARKAAVNETRTYQPTSRDLERQHDVFEEEIAEVDQLIKKAFSNTEDAFPDGETAERIRELRHWKELLESQRDELADLPSPPASTYAASYQGQAKAPTIPYAARLQEEIPKGCVTQATPKTNAWKMEKWQARRPEKSAVYDKIYRTEEPEPGEAARQGDFRRYVKSPSPEERLYEYMALMDQPDFEEKSVYQNTYHKDREKFSAVAGIFTNTGFDDILYDYINGNDIARERISLAPGVRIYAPVSEETVRLFNYIYRTKSPEEAYDFMDLISQKQYTGIEATALGAVDKMGVTFLSTALNKGFSALTGNEGQWQDPLKEDIRMAREQHPIAYGAGAVGGNVALALGLGTGFHELAGRLATGIRIGGRTIQVVLPKVVEGTVNSSLTFLSKAAIQNAGVAATGEMSGEEYLKSIGTAGAQGMAGGLAGGLVNSGLETVLRESGMMTGFMEFVKQSTAGFAAASANTGTGYVLSEEKPSGEQIAMDLTTAFLFSVIQGGISAYQTTNATKTYMEKQYEHILSDYSKMSREWNTLTPEEQAEYAQVIRGYTQQLRAGLHVEYLAGQQGFVNDMTRALDTLDKAMEVYTSHSAPGGSGTAGTLVPAGGNELALRLQESIAEGLSAASVPMAQEKEAGVLSAFRDTQAPSGITKTGLVDDATADKLLRNQSMVDFLTRKGGLDLRKGMTQEEKRAAVKEAVENVIHKGRIIDHVKTLDTEQGKGYDEIKKRDLPGGSQKRTGQDQKDRPSEEEMTEEELGALLQYKSSESYTLNAALRDGAFLSQSQQKMMEILDQAVKKASVYQGTVYRRMSFDMVGKEAFEAFLREHQPGTLIRYPAFTSTSSEIDGYTLDGELTITLVIKSKNGRNMDGYGNNFEQEVLFPRLSTFYIDRVEIDEQGTPVIYMEEVIENGI